MLWAVLLLLAAGVANSKDLADDADKYLLPWNLRPEHYELSLFTHIDLFDENNEDSFDFHGIVEITLGVFYGNVSEAVLHSNANISFVSIAVVSLDEVPAVHDVTVGNFDPETHKQSLLVTPPLKNYGRYRFTIYYAAKNTKNLHGFYRSSFVDSNGQKKWLLTTHFESFGAREAFPCFDEPEYKATYKLTAYFNESLYEQGYRAHFNTEIESEEINNGRRVVTFKKTPRPLSSYLVAFIIAPFESSPEPTYFNSSFNGEDGLKPVWTIGQPKYFSPRQDELSQIAAPAALNALTKLTKVGFGFDKVEQAGIPDFAAGAMENWGLVTYRETALFFNNETGTSQQKQSIMSTTTHELAHQWFGDLVTLHWWTDVWLNEGFATYFATHAADTFREPGLDTSTWDLIGQFVTGSLQRTAFVTDAKPTSRPLTAEAYDRPTIDAYFDGISYDKGGSVLRMWMHALGGDIFYRGLERYLRSQEESIGTPEILLASLDGAWDSFPVPMRPSLPDTIAKLFRGWHQQAGYPVVNVTRNEGLLTLQQERFLSSPGDDSTRWNIPLTYSTDLEPNFNSTAPVGYLLDSDETTTIRLGGANATWVVVNNQEAGYYRVNYEKDNWNKLLAIVNNPDTANQIHPYNRAQILDDSANLGGSTHKNYLDISVALDFLTTLRHERDLVVWNSGLSFIDQLTNIFENDEAASKSLKEFFLWLVTPAFEDFTLFVQESDTHTDKLLRAKVAKLACELGVPLCQQQAQHLLKLELMHPDVRGTVMCEKVRSGDSLVWEATLEESLKAGDLSVRSDLLAALACTKNRTLLTRLLTIIRINDVLIDTDAVIIMLALHNNPLVNTNQIIEAAQTRRFLDSGTQKKVISALSRHLVSYDGLAPIEDLKSTVDNNVLWVRKNQLSISSWLEQHNF